MSELCSMLANLAISKFVSLLPLPLVDVVVELPPLSDDELNNMFDKIFLFLLNKLNEITKQHDSTSRIVLDHDWEQYLQPIGWLGMDLFHSSDDLRQVVDVLLDSNDEHHHKMYKQLLANVRSCLVRTHNRLVTTIKEHEISDELFTASLTMLTNYVPHTFNRAKRTSTIEDVTTSTQSHTSESMSLDVALTQLLNYSDITVDGSSDPDTENVNTSSSSGTRRKRNRKSKKDRNKHTHCALWTM